MRESAFRQQGQITSWLWTQALSRQATCGLIGADSKRIGLPARTHHDRADSHSVCRPVIDSFVTHLAAAQSGPGRETGGHGSERKEKRIETKPRIFYALSLTGRDGRGGNHGGARQDSASQGHHQIEVRKALYEMLSEECSSDDGLDRLSGD